MLFVIEGSGWPYWPPVLPNNRTVESHTGILGVIVRTLYVLRGFIIFIGLLFVLYWILSLKIDERKEAK